MEQLKIVNFRAIFNVLYRNFKVPQHGQTDKMGIDNGFVADWPVYTFSSYEDIL